MRRQIAGFLRKYRFPLVLLLISLSVYGYFSLHSYFGGYYSGWRGVQVGGVGVSNYYTGDEPHYLLFVKSLVEGHLYVEEVYKDPRPEYKTWLWQVDTIEGPDGHFYSSHGIGLPLLAAPFYLIGGDLGVALFTPLITAMIGLCLYFACRRITGNEAVSFTTALIMGFATLLCSYSDQFYPELPMALLSLLAINLFLKYGLTNRAQLAMGLLVGYGFLLKAAYAAMVVGFGLALLLVCIRRARWNFALFAGGVMVWFAVLCVYSYIAFGNPFGMYHTLLGSLEINPIYAATGLIFDRNYGILPYCPVLALSLFGLNSLAKKSTEVFAMVTGIICADYALVSLYQFWWAGDSYPARYLVSVLPLFGLPISLAIKSNWSKWWFRAGTFAAVYLGLYLNLTFSWERGIGLMINAAKSEVLSRAYLGLDRFFPNVAAWGTSMIECMLWLGGLLAILFLSMWGGRVKKFVGVLFRRQN